MIDRSPRCYITSFVEIGPPVAETMVFKDLSIYGHGGHLGHKTSIISTNFDFHVPKSLHTKFN